jgi:hypothetical protein
MSIVNAQVEMMHDSLRNNQQIAHRYIDLQALVSDLQRQSDVLDRLDTGVKISDSLGELSYLAGENIIFTTLDYRGEVFKSESISSQHSVRLKNVRSAKKDSMPSENMRFKLVLKGVAANAADVTAFIARLEESDYLCQVIPGILKNIKDTSAADFEISCYIANYIIEEF